MYALVTTQNIDQPVAFILMMISIAILIFGCILAAIDNKDQWTKGDDEQ